ncbi:hypothetical protein DPSP01_010317 [Paraphaeosphaeria sporulosa]|uniref:Uncharacterized protein n=1 Tax=Paraphaeosphaeria sporulosa TaxID=1460663 RepID=A0A177CES3_9PLEO|nr:uncharacterized protein CC84DRAFT_834392 [Paraphaeosphaeria sporulosa]OAG05298.1 hypothetical protein CC84DRAFT_834392 [Paraphaeosphaeria sporulosa]
MPSAIGPLDGRKARRKRCNACVRRKIKCHGGIPCDYCRRMKQTCESPTLPTTFAPVFVGENANGNPRGKQIVHTATERTGFSFLRFTAPTMYDSSVPYFFMSFLAMNNLSNDRLPVVADLVNLMADAPALRDAISAVAVHHRKQQSPEAVPLDGYQALQSYGRSIRHVKDLITSKTFLHDPSALWTTFFLGLFELMRDSTGTTWLSHFLHGTCAMLKLLEPETLSRAGPRNSHRRIFFLQTRIFEISRSLIYSSPTFLWDAKWTAAIANLWDGDSAALWHPKEALFDLLPSFSELSICVLQFALNETQLPPMVHHNLAQSLADEGFALQEKLQGWYEETQSWEQMCKADQASSISTSWPDTELMIGYAYYHAINIYLSGTYDYHKPWTGPGAPRAPILTRDEIDLHVSRILHHSRSLLAHGISGIILFFPLRVAGARAIDLSLRQEILSLFQLTSQRGFVVAEALVDDLLELWGSKNYHFFN